MLDTNTMSLILAMTGFIFIAVIMVHKHNSAEEIRRKRGEVEDFTARLSAKIDILDQEIIDLKIKIDELDEEIDAYTGQGTA